MFDAVPFLPIAAAGLGVAMAHAALPTHWLPFVLTARSQGWGRGKTLSVTVLAGMGHVAFTTMLGAMLVGLGLAIDEWLGDVLPFVAGGVLIAFGLYHFMRRGHRHIISLPHRHVEDVCGCGDPAHAAPDLPPRPIPTASSSKQERPARSDLAAILGLLAVLTLSPCESFLPVYLSAANFGWRGFVLLSLVLAIGTVAAMVVLTSLTMAGIGRLRTGVLERYENVIIGVLLCLLGIAVIVIEQGHHHD